MTLQEQMLDMLTSAYNRRKDGNIGKLMGIFAEGLEKAGAAIEDIRAWRDLYTASGRVLDRMGGNYGVQRDGADDAFYRVLILQKMLAAYCGGDGDTVIRAAAALLAVAPEEVELEEVFPAKLRVYVDQAHLGEQQLATIDPIAFMLNRIVAAGIGIKMILVETRSYQTALYINTGAAVKTSLKIRPPEINRSISGKIFSIGGYATISYISIRPKS